MGWPRGLRPQNLSTLVKILRKLAKFLGILLFKDFSDNRGIEEG
jgi:hypothetical protein